MTFVSTGKASIINQPHRAFTRGLLGMDQQEIQRKAREKQAYQDQLRLQMEQDQKRKQMEKQKRKEEDQRLTKKIQMQQQIDKQREEDQKKSRVRKVQKQQTVNLITNQKQPERQNNYKNQIQQSLGNSMVQKHTQSKPQVSMFKNYNENDEDSHSFQRNNYHTHSAYDVQQERYIREDQEDRFRRYRQSLDQKVQQIYRQIKSSKDALRSQNIIDDIRRKLNANNYKMQEYQQLQKSSLKQFQEQFSQFYRIPKKNSYTEDATSRIKNRNLEYGSQSRFKSSLKNHQNNYYQNANYQQKNTQNNYLQKSKNHDQRDNTQRLNFRNETQYQNKPSKWGNKRKDNFLGNRQALDYQVDSMLSNIDNILTQHGQVQY